MIDEKRRENVIRGLELCAYDPDPGQTRKDVHSCSRCPYYDHGCEGQLYRDVLTILKEQEPRVMTREEVLVLPEGAVVWFEERSDDSRDYIGPLVSDGNGFFGDFGRGVDMHAVELKRQRCWTSRPTPEQMRDTPWKGDSDAE